MKIRNGLVLAIAVLFGVTGCASGGGGGGGGGGGVNPGALAAMGERPRDTENTRAAERALEAAAESEGDEAAMHYNAASERALAAVAEDGTNPLAHRLAALAALGLNDYGEAATHFDHAGELSPLFELEDRGTRERVWIDLYNRAAPMIGSGDYEGAAVIFEDANLIYQGRPEVMITLGQIYATLGDHDRSLENMSAATDFLDSEYMAEADSAQQADWREQTDILPMLRAQVLADGGRFEEAATAFAELRAADPTNLEYVRGHATVLMQSGQETEALAVYQELLSQPGLSGADYYSIGVGFYQAEDYAQAASAFGGAAEQTAQDRDALEMWARSLQLAESFEEIPPVAERWIELDPYSQNGYLILAQAANSTGDTEATQEAIRAVDALEVSVDQLQLRRAAGGGGTVSGSVINKTLSQGAGVTLRFTFFAPDGVPVGSVTTQVTVGEADMAAIFTAQFDSGEEVGGYSYELTVN